MSAYIEALPADRPIFMIGQPGLPLWASGGPGAELGDLGCCGAFVNMADLAGCGCGLGQVTAPLSPQAIADLRAKCKELAGMATNLGKAAFQAMKLPPAKRREAYVALNDSLNRVVAARKACASRLAAAGVAP